MAGTGSFSAPSSWLPIEDGERALRILPGWSGDTVLLIETRHGVKVRKYTGSARAKALHAQVELLQGCLSGAVPVCATRTWPTGFSYDMPYLADSLPVLPSLAQGRISARSLIAEVAQLSRGFPVLPDVSPRWYLARALKRARNLPKDVSKQLENFHSVHGSSWEQALGHGQVTGTHGDLSVNNVLIDPYGRVLLLDPVASPAPRRFHLDMGKLTASALVQERMSHQGDSVHVLVRELRSAHDDQQWVSVQAHAVAHLCRMVPYVQALPKANQAVARVLSDLLSDFSEILS